VVSASRSGEATPPHTLFGSLDVIADQSRVHREPTPFSLLVNTSEDLPGTSCFEKHCVLRHTPPTATKRHTAQLQDLWG
jgi:hypothetical protein